MSVSRRKGSPYYYAEFQIAGRRFFRSTKATTEREARAEERRLKQVIREQQRQARSAVPGLTHERAFELYWQEHGQHLAATWASEVDRYCAQILERIDGDMLVSDLTDAEVNDFVQERVTEGGGTYAINRALAVWRGMHNRARTKWKQPTHAIDWSGFMNAEEQRVRWLTLEEAQRLIACLPQHVAIAVEWSLATGCREAETYGLRWDNVHMDRSYVMVAAKGGNRQIIRLTEQALDILARVPHGNGPVFDKCNQRKLFEEGLAAAGIEDFCWHDLRHTHATWLRQSGVALEVVQRSLRHTKITTTARYAHVADTELDEALRRLPSISPSQRKVIGISEKKING